MKIVIVDYGMGNLYSVVKSLEYAKQSLGSKAMITLSADPEKIRKADKIVFPGQGAMPECMASLKKTGLSQVLRESFREKPFLGICIGAQLLFTESEEGATKGLGWYTGRVVRFEARDAAPGNDLKIPHMGWNNVHQEKKHPLFAAIAQDSDFYFVHSYYFAPENPEAITIATTDYGRRFPSIIGTDNVFATQFHPEKSGKNGLQLLQNFILWDGQS